MVNTKRILELLEIIRNKCCSWQTAERHEKYLKELYTLIPEEEMWKLKVAYDHYSSCGEGSAEFHEVCKRLKEKYLSSK